MATVKKTSSGEKKVSHVAKTTTQGHSKFSRLRSKNDRRLKKLYRGQGK